MNIGEALAALPQTRILRSAARAVVFGKGNHERVESEDCVRNPVADREDEAGLPVMRHGAAGIDLGSEVHWVCAPKINGKGRDVATFGATTPELEKMAFWLKERKVDTVALESTGVYWIAPHEVIERHGLELVLMNTGELARVPGRKKTDRIDCKWIGQKRGGMVSLSVTVATTTISTLLWMSIPAIVRAMSSFRARKRQAARSIKYGVLRAYSLLNRKETSQRLVQYTRPGSNSFTDSPAPQRLLPLPFPALVILPRTGTHFHPLRWAIGPWALLNSRGSVDSCRVVAGYPLGYAVWFI